jgi:hypothetical protein
MVEQGPGGQGTGGGYLSSSGYTILVTIMISYW